VSTPPAKELVSVVIPTLLRPDLLRKAVTSVLRQDLPAGWAVEVVIALSDPSSTSDVEAAADLARDPRVKVIPAPAPGAGAARNAGVAAAGGGALAFMDDDCEAQPGWLRAGLAALAQADLVQGRTAPAGEVPPFHHSLWVDPPSWLWESCNLFCSREAFERTSGFNIAWNAQGRLGNQYGEDVEWGWAMIRGGARPGFARDALVHHEVVPRTFGGYLRYVSRMRVFPRLFRNTPEVRRIFYLGHFVDQRHVALTATAGMLAGAAATRAAGRQGLAGVMLGGAVATYLWPYRGMLISGRLRSAYSEFRFRGPKEAVEFAAVVYGSIRWRRILL
jgi:glycosyltransferase involved in cell wall biosynthesis